MMTFHDDETELTNAYLIRRHSQTLEARLPYFGAWHMFRENIKDVVRAVSARFRSTWVPRQRRKPA